MEIKRTNEIWNEIEKGVVYGNTSGDFMLKKWVAVDDILKNIQDMKALWEEDVLKEEWFDSLIKDLTVNNQTQESERG